MAYIGERVLRKEDQRLLTGRGRYIADIVFPGMLHAALLRSPYAHARIDAINTTAAEKVPGVAAVLTFTDLGAAARPVPVIPPHPALDGRNFHLLAGIGNSARFVGEAVAVVVATSQYAAEDARELIDVDYQPLPSVQDPCVATTARVHDDIAGNLAGRVVLRHGDVESVLATAPHIASERLVIGRGGGQPLETRGIAAEYSTLSGLLTICAASQVPHQIRQIVCDFLGLPPHRVRVVTPDVGGGFGAKLIVYPEDVLIPLLAYRLERPVRWIESRVEHMLSATQERSQTHNVTVAFDDAGTLLGVRDNFVHDNGAYTPRGLVVPMLTASMLAGPYRIPNIEVTLESIYTHRVPVTPYRGAGQPQAVFVIERILDLIARKTGVDRAKVRAINLVRPDDMPYNVGLTNYRNSGPVIYDGGDYPAVLRRALKLADYDTLAAECKRARGAGKLRGVGLACHVELTGVGPFEGACARVDSTGRITIFTGATSQGQGLETTLAQVAASEFGVTPDDIHIVAGDTLGIDYGIGTFASRAAVAGGNAVALAAQDLRTKTLQLAARVLGVPVAEVEQEGTAFVQAGRNRRRVELGQLAATAAMASAADDMEPGLEATRYFQPTDLTHSSGAHVALVEVDADTGAVKVEGYWLCHDCGQPINPTVVEGQIHGAVALGIGSALLEEVTYDDAGQPLAGSFMDYALPRAADLPMFVTDHLETPSQMNPLGLRGVGESGTLPVPAVIASAIEDALSEQGSQGPRVRHMPLTLRVMQELVRQE